ncbi:cupin domain-containing protein [Limnobacter humi]|uniref:Cupin domain-containing protein n=1 Tax=Limnobacter humi TaxID=1778671 RepID=A0ABT1WI47_9BURK|nr:cupin domain-containing protein [Limnobacter humi]MCQ8897197.1 cupin domain-containing protein [Limnobacter humi]
MIPALSHLSGLPVETFMNEDWHVRPRLFRAAFPDFEPLCDLDTIAEMASDEDIESRLIQRKGEQWHLEQGPFEKLPLLQTKGWTVLIQGVDQVLPEAYELLHRFRFIPDARLDDVMLSLASDQGGVGPHYDSYDVFLLQMHGTRRWKIGPLRNARLRTDTPLKILEGFEPTEEYVLEPGDMLYLPPNYGHEGIAEGICSTLSIGFRAPTHAEVLGGLLRDLADTVEHTASLKNSLFSDPQRGQTTTPAELPTDLVKFARQLLDEFKPEIHQLEKSLGCLLTEPKPHVYFVHNTEDMSPSEILKVLKARGIALSMKTKMLFRGDQCFINGEAIAPKTASCLKLLQILANEHEMDVDTAESALQDKEFQYFLIGFAKAGWVETLN